MFKEQIAVVTGASSGIGRAIALSLAEKGAICYLLGRNKERLEEVANIARKNSPLVHTLSLDLTIDENIRLLYEQLNSDFGRVNILVHSSGIYASNLFNEATVEDFDKLFSANVRAPYLLTQSLLPLIR